MYTSVSPAVSALFGVVLFGVAFYQFYTGVAAGRFKRYGREENTGHFWFLIICEVAYGSFWLHKAITDGLGAGVSL